MPDSLETRLRTLEDKEAIRGLIARYGPFADSGDSEGIAGLWADDGSYAVGGMTEAKGKAAIADLIDGEMHRQLMREGCAHLLGPVAIELDGDVAVARGHSIVFRHVGARFEAWRVSANRWELERGDQGWQVRRRVNAPLDGSEAARALLRLS
jgi:uncharacterized protein (TIGR02246 family)